jgi:hypothetical protein
MPFLGTSHRPSELVVRFQQGSADTTSAQKTDLVPVSRLHILGSKNDGR